MKIFFLFLFAFFAEASQACFASNPISVDFINNKGDKIGSAQLQELDQGLLIKYDLTLPEGPHAMHIHQNAKCETPDFKSAGAHFDPDNHKHGYLNKEGFHAGDLPNIYVESTGHIKGEIYSTSLELGGDVGLDKGASIIIHEKADDYSSDPSGNAGNRIACGLIKG